MSVIMLYQKWINTSSILLEMFKKKKKKDANKNKFAFPPLVRVKVEVLSILSATPGIQHWTFGRATIENIFVFIYESSFYLF